MSENHLQTSKNIISAYKLNTITGILLTITGCSHPVTHEELKIQGLTLDASGYYSKSNLKNKFFVEKWTEKAPTIGLALAGGGTKAADFSLGVIQGLDKNGLLRNIDMISTVSGGSYAGLWYYARNMYDHEEAATKTIYDDCLPFRYATELKLDGKIEIINPCPKNNLTNFEIGNRDGYRYQNYLRGYQDIFSSGTDMFGRRAFNYASTNEPARNTNDIGQLIFLSLGAAVINIIPNIIFDWEIPLSPSRVAYGNGIARTFGASPPRCDENGCGDELLNMHNKNTEASFRAEGDITQIESFGFQALRTLTETYNLPLWIINTTAGEDRSPWDFSGQGAPEKTVFEFTPYGHGSGTYGYHLAELKDITPLDAVKSSAAFLDSQQKSELPMPLRKGLAAPLMDVFTLNWGRSYVNPEISPANLAIHHLLPWPLYYLHRFNAGRDSAFIHLSDGGQSENLGAYSLIRRGVDTIIISDHSYDRAGRMDDVCRLKEELYKLGYTVILPGLPDLDRVCLNADDKQGYDIFNWKHPILLGCIVGNAEKHNCSRMSDHWDRESGSYFARIFLIKPALADDKLRDALLKMSSGKRDRKDAVGNVIRELCLADQGHTLNTPWRFKGGLSCELIWFMHNNSFDKGAVNSNDGCPEFPQYSTVNMTLNSSPWIYGASRELGDYYSRQLSWFYNGKELNVVRFNEVLEFQSS